MEIDHTDMQTMRRYREADQRAKWSMPLILPLGKWKQKQADLHVRGQPGSYKEPQRS